MFSELIYTRCRHGIDILSGRAISSDGFKVYACTSSLMQDGNTDLQFLFNAAQSKQPYHDPGFMDDAYLYVVPDKGDAFMVNFHPVPFDATAKGDYSHRAGNFVNHVLVGDYSGFYPFELFRDPAVWNAKARGEAFYYENAHADLPIRSDIGDPAGQINIDDIAAFIADGRQDALKAAVSFLIAQYELPAENRKFLVIRDGTEQIELWIAAIEHAFSPRIAAAVPFATRLDKFVSANRYTVNQSGVYQTQINLQDRNQKKRNRAMIVGVDERDRVNTAAARPLANSPFVVLDGKEKRVSFEADTSHRYYRHICAFDEAHQMFCREFLQMLDIHAPSSEIHRLYDIYMDLEHSVSLPNADTLAQMLAVLGKYNVFASSMLKNLYNRITDDLPRFLKENLHSALQITKWLQMAAQIVGDHTASERLTDIVCKAFEEQVFRKSDSEGTFNFWESIRNSEFAGRVASYIVAPATLQSYNAQLQQFKVLDAITFVLIYMECALFTGTVSRQDMQTVVDYGLKTCERENDARSAQKILGALSQSGPSTAQDMLLSIAREANQGYADYIVKLLIQADKSIIATDSSMIDFYRKLGAEGMEHLFIHVLKCRIDTLTRPVEIEQFLKLIHRIQPLSRQHLAEIFEGVDTKLVIGDKGSSNAALTIQHEKPDEAQCSKSAHLYALEVLSDRRKRPEFTRIFDTLIPQGFPVETNRDYIRTLTEKLLKAQMKPEELDYIIQLFSRVPAYMAELVSAILEMTTPKRNDEWNALIAVAAHRRDQATDTVIIEECAKLNKREKALAQLGDMLVSGESLDYFRYISEQAKQIVRSRKPQSGIARLFGGVFSRDDADK